jgi:WD40 repeat protein
VPGRRVLAALLAGLLVAVLLPVTTLATEPGSQLWVNRYVGPGNRSDRAAAMAVSPDGTRIFVTGSSDGGESGAEYGTIAYDASGTQLWVKRYNGPGHGHDVATAIAVSPDGSKVFVTGRSTGISGFDYATVAYKAASGAPLWVKRYNGPANRTDEATAMAISPDGTKLFVSGRSNGKTFDYATVAYKVASGAQLWVKRYTGPGYADEAKAVAVSPDGTKVFVTGRSKGSTSGLDYATVAYSADGTQLWVKRYNGPGNGTDEANVVAVSPDGTKVFVTGSSRGEAGYSDYATVAYKAAGGGQLWVKRYDGPGHGHDTATAIAVSPDGTKLFVTGSSTGTSDFDYATVAYSADGTKLWVKRYNGPADRTDEATAIVISPNGTELVVTGRSMGNANSSDYATVRYDAASGTELWVKRYNGPGGGTNFATAMAVSPDGSKVFVTGTSPGSESDDHDYATVAYEAATGTELWVKRYNGPGGGIDVATALAVSPDGSQIFVTGSSRGSNTLAYNAATGVELWATRHDSSATAIATSPDGKSVFVTGSSYDDGAYYYATAAYDAATGAELWMKHYGGGGGAYAIAVSPDGTKVFVTGSSFPSYATLAYDAASGVELWLNRYNGPGNDRDVANAIAVSPDGAKVFVTGRSKGNTTSFDYATLAYDAAGGAQLWLKRYNGPGDGRDEANAIAVSADGTRVFVTGSSKGAASSGDYATIAYSSSGAQQWVKRYNGPANLADAATGVTVKADGTRVFVTGRIKGKGSGFDYATIAYSAGGARLWVQRYNGPGNGADEATAMAVNPNGTKVFVTGRSTGKGSGFDYATIAYSSGGASLWVKRYDGPADATDEATAIAVGRGSPKVFVTGGSTGNTSGFDYATVAYALK